MMSARFAALALAGALAACNGSDTPEEPAGFDAAAAFPATFLFGTATAGFQVDLGCPTAPCPDLQSDWYQWATDQRIIDEELVNGDDVHEGPGHWELYESDHELMAGTLHNNGFRMSIEWSRLFTQSTEGVTDHAALRALADPEGLAKYHAMFDSLKAKGITPIVTLIHYSMPLWIHDGVACHFDPEGCENRGWMDGDRLIPEMAKYAGFAAKEFGDKVDLWATLNEPYAVVVPGYTLPSKERTNPPGISDAQVKWAPIVIRNMIEAHARMYDAIHAGDTVDADGDGVNTMVGLVPNLAPTYPMDPEKERDVKAAENAHKLYNEHMLDPLILGDYDTDLDGTPDEVREDLKGRMDFVGINYYTRLTVSGLSGPLVPHIPLFTFMPDTTNLFAVFPQGIYEVAMFVKERYGLPIYITENGTVSTNDDTETAPAFLVDHLSWIRKAIADGADVRGYMFWSFIDNYEWNHGFGMEFGLFDYDRTTKARTLKKVGEVYSGIAEAGRLTPEILEAHRTEAGAH